MATMSNLGESQKARAVHGAKLTLAMVERDLSSSNLADLTAVSERTVRNWAAGRTMPSAEQADALRRVLGDYA
jgi:DNA-binding transcriptional regulator YiaG